MSGAEYSVGPDLVRTVKVLSNRQPAGLAPSHQLVCPGQLGVCWGNKPPGPPCQQEEGAGGGEESGCLLHRGKAAHRVSSSRPLSNLGRFLEGRWPWLWLACGPRLPDTQPPVGSPGSVHILLGHLQGTCSRPDISFSGGSTAGHLPPWKGYVGAEMRFVPMEFPARREHAALGGLYIMDVRAGPWGGPSAPCRPADSSTWAPRVNDQPGPAGSVP